MSRFQYFLQLFGFKTKLIGLCEIKILRGYLDIFFQVVYLPAQYVIFLAELFLDLSPCQLIFLNLVFHPSYLFFNLSIDLVYVFCFLNVFFVVFGSAILAIS